MKLYKGNIACVGRKSPFSLYDENIASMEGVKSDYNQDDAHRIYPPAIAAPKRARAQAGRSRRSFCKKIESREGIAAS